jgi:7 transmembrane sweet-taste receptor of 3 GCPR
VTNGSLFLTNRLLANIFVYYFVRRKLDKVFNATSLKRVKITFFDSFIRCFVQISGFLIFLAFLQGLGVPKVATEVELAANRLTIVPYCSLEYNEFETALFVVEAIILTHGAYLCYRVSGVPDAVNESSYITRSMMFIAFACLVILPVEYIVPNLDEHQREIMTSVGFASSVIVTVSLIFIPKCIVLLSGRDMDKDMKVEKAKASGNDSKVYASDASGSLVGGDEKTLELIEAGEKALKACKNADEASTLAQSQAAWWRQKATGTQSRVKSSSDASCSRVSGANPVQKDPVVKAALTEAASALNENVNSEKTDTIGSPGLIPGGFGTPLRAVDESSGNDDEVSIVYCLL